MKFSLGGQSKDYNSKKARGKVINLIPEGDKGEYKTVKKAEGLTLFATLGLQPVRSDPLINGGFLYAVGGANLYRVTEAGAVTSLGTVGGTGRGAGSYYRRGFLFFFFGDCIRGKVLAFTRWNK
mgnify:CR=1 FL=1